MDIYYSLHHLSVAGHRAQFPILASVNSVAINVPKPRLLQKKKKGKAESNKLSYLFARSLGLT